jgi:predicted acetyltransferase
MISSSLTLSMIGPESEVLLRNLFQYYLHDMAEWFEIDTQADGSYSYDISKIWENGHDAYLAKVGDSIACFASAGSAVEWLGDFGAHDVHEFFVIRRHRRSGCGRRMATLLWTERPGAWLVRVLELNAPAVLFWRTAISSHSDGAYEEEGRIVNGRPWRFFTFVSKELARTTEPGSAGNSESFRSAGGRAGPVRASEGG